MLLRSVSDRRLDGGRSAGWSGLAAWGRLASGLHREIEIPLTALSITSNC